MDKKGFIRQIQSLLAESQVEEALDLMQNWLEEHPEYGVDTVIHLKASYHRARLNSMKNLTTYEEFGRETAKIVDGILTILKELEVPVPIGNKKRTRKWTYLAVATLGICLLVIAGYRLIESLGKPHPETPLTEKVNGDSSLADKPEKIEPSSSVAEKPEVTDKQEHPLTENIVGSATPVVNKYQVILKVNSDLSDAAIYVNGEEAVIIKETLLFKTIEVKEKEGNTLIELKRNGRVVCDVRQKVSGDMSITLPCSN